jgi:hypothetical protein
MASVPFRIRGVYRGIFRLEGIARLEPGVLVLEYQTRHVVLEFIKSPPKEARIPLSDIEQAVFRRRLLGGLLKLRAGRLDAFRQIPGARGGELKLRCRREYSEVAADLASRINLRAVTQDLQQMIAANERPAEIHSAPAVKSLPHPKTSVPQ